MEYSTRIGVLDISNYNQLFRTYVDSNLTKVAIDLNLLGLPVVDAKGLILIQDRPPTMKPTEAPVPAPTQRPVTESPTEFPTMVPTTQKPTSVPSAAPSVYVTVPKPQTVPVDNGFGLGLFLGLAGAFAISAVALLYMRQREKKAEALRKERDDLAQNPTHSTEAYHHQNDNIPPHYGKGSGGSSGALGTRSGGGEVSPATLELTPNEDGRIAAAIGNVVHHEHRHGSHDDLVVGQGELLNAPPHGQEDVSSAGMIPRGQQQLQQQTSGNSPHGTLVRSPHGTTGRSPHGTLEPMSPQALRNEMENNDNNNNNNKNGGGNRVYTSSPVLQPFGGEVMDTIFSTTESTSPGTGAGTNAAAPNVFSSQYNHDERNNADHRPDDDGARLPATRRDSSAIGQSMTTYPMHHMGGFMINDEAFSSSDSEDVNAHREGSGRHHSHRHHGGSHHGGSHHQDVDEWCDPFALDGSQDELDNYKNQDLDTLRTAVEDVVDGVEGMMSLAVTRALTAEDASFEGLPWAGAQDNGSIEASCLCETYDWLKRQDDTFGLDSINEYFQDVLNRIVVTTMLGMINPLQGAQLIHGCAAILGLDLMRQPLGTTLVIAGMRKTNDLAQGHNFIVKAFKPFGKIEEAAIAPNNRGFGFVRFAKPESVQRALKKYRESEIEIQDVSVSIKTLKSERPR
mmetsp:Transcript_1026/g.2203  ORF Transcript_1026/g.2203 Transcript_1026/m.2203 type:complete len:680 (+) Transcript_1026:297-2336(+)